MDPSQTVPPVPRRGLRVAAIVAAAVLLAAAGAGVGMAFADDDHPADHPDNMSAAPHSGGHVTAGRHGKTGRQDTAQRQAWARQYGQDRSTMPNLPDVASATPQQQAAATDLLTRTQASTARYADVAAAKAAGYDLDASLAHAKSTNPRYQQLLDDVDAGRMPKRMPMLHVANKANRHDGKVLDPTAPETLMYEYQGHNAWKLVGVMYTANESYPQAPPDPGGPITRWHYHSKHGGLGLMMHVFFFSDLAHAYALTMDGM